MNAARVRAKGARGWPRSARVALLALAGCLSCAEQIAAPGSGDAGVLVDVVPPRVLAVSPADGEREVAPQAVLTVEFSEAVRAETVNERAWTLSDEAGRATALVITVDASARRASAAPVGSLVEGATYRSALNDRITDRARNALQPVSWRFTVARLPLGVVGVEPPEGAPAQRGDVRVRVFFDRAVDPASVAGQVSVRAVGAPLDHPGLIDTDAPTRTLSFTPTREYPSNTEMELTLGAGLRTMAGGTLPAPLRARFRILDGPRVLSISPEDGARDVPTDSSVRVVFDRDVEARSLTAETLALTIAGGAVVPTRLQAEAQAVNLTPEAPLYEGARLEVRVGPGVRSREATTQDSVVRARFDVASTVPTLRAIDPPDGAREVPRNAAVTLFFSEPLAPGSVTLDNVRLLDPFEQPLAATLTTLDPATFRLTPAELLPPASNITVRIVDGPRDPYGYRVAAPVTRAFTTAAAATHPRIWPAFGAIDVPASHALALSFAQPMSSISNALTLRDDTDALVPFTLAAFDDERTFELRAALSPGRRYGLFFEGALARERTGLTLSESRATRFAVADSAVDAAPRVMSTTPADGAVAVSPEAAMQVTFDAPVSPAELSRGVELRAFTDAGGAGVPLEVTHTLSEDGRTVALAPASPLALSTRHVVSVTAPLRGPSGQLATPRSFTFVTRAPVAPALLDVAPRDGTRDASPTTLVQLVFDREIDAETVSAEGESRGERLLLAVNYPSRRTRYVLLEPVAGFPADAPITVTLAPGVRSTEGAETLAPHTLAFSTAAEPDALAPAAVQHATPAQWPRGPLAFSWNEPILLPSFAPSSVMLRDVLAARAVLADVSSAPHGFEVTPRAPLDSARAYELWLPEGIEDLSGNLLDASARTRSLSLDPTAPALSSWSPPDADAPLPRDAPVVLTFSRPMRAASFTEASLLWRTPDGTPLRVAARLSDDGLALRVLPTALLGPGLHTLTLNAALAREEGGLALGDIPVVLTFRVAPAP